MEEMRRWRWRRALEEVVEEMEGEVEVQGEMEVEEEDKEGVDGLLLVQISGDLCQRSVCVCWSGTGYSFTSHIVTAH